MKRNWSNGGGFVDQLCLMKRGSSAIHRRVTIGVKLKKKKVHEGKGSPEIREGKGSDRGGKGKCKERGGKGKEWHCGGFVVINHEHCHKGSWVYISVCVCMSVCLFMAVFVRVSSNKELQKKTLARKTVLFIHN